MSLLFCFLDSSEICIHKASDKASATAIVNIHHITIILDSLPNANHIINHKVVITPDIAPKFIQVLTEFLIVLDFNKINLY